MIGITPDKVRQDIASISALSYFNEHIRSHFIDEVDLSAIAAKAGATKYVEARRYIAEPLQWKVFSHCASVTRLYALYEGFVYELLSVWLTIVPSLYESYALLPDAIIKQHRIGVGILLQKFGGGSRTEELTELNIVQPIFNGLSGQQGFSLIPDAFFIDSRNLRHEELCGLFKKVSLDDLSSWLAGHADLNSMCDAAGTTLIGRLKELVDFRNEASHARQEIDETLGVSAFHEFAEFVQTLCAALHQFVLVRYVDVLQEMGRLELLGKVTEYLPRPDAAILTTHAKVQVTVGDEVVVRGHLICFSAKIIDLQDHDQGLQSAIVNAGYELGVRFNPTVAKEGVLVFRLQPPNSEVNRVAAFTDGTAALPAKAAVVALDTMSRLSNATPAIPADADTAASKANSTWDRMLKRLRELRRYFRP